MSVKRIHRKGDFRHEEALTGAAGLKPGMLVKLKSDGTLKALDIQGGFAERAVLTEDALQGKTVSDAYDNGAVASYALFAPGSEFNGLLKSGQNVNIGDLLVSSDDGKFVALTESASTKDVEKVMAVAVEAIDASSGDKLGAMRML